MYFDDELYPQELRSNSSWASCRNENDSKKLSFKQIYGKQTQHNQPPVFEQSSLENTPEEEESKEQDQLLLLYQGDISKFSFSKKNKQQDPQPFEEEQQSESEDETEETENQPEEGQKDYFIPPQNIGYKMLKNIGWDESQGLGAQNQGTTKPLNPTQLWRFGKFGLGKVEKVQKVTNHFLRIERKKMKTKTLNKKKDKNSQLKKKKKTNFQSKMEQIKEKTKERDLRWYLNN